MRIAPRMLRALGWCWLVTGLAAIPFAFMAMAEAAIPDMRGFAASAALGLFLGALTLIGTRFLEGPAHAPAALRLSLYAWLTTPLIAAPSFIMVASSPMAGIFEAYSAMTTTGATVFSVEELSRTMVLWRAILQWLGGFASVVLIVTIFAAIEPLGSTLRRSSLLTVEDADLFTNFGRATRRLGQVYASLTLAGFAAFIVSGVAPFYALTLTLTSISTGGMMPYDGPVNSQLGPPVLIIMAVLCMAGAWNMSSQFEIFSRGRTIRKTGDLRALVGITVLASALVFILIPDTPRLTLLTDTVFALTTAGFQSSSESLPSVYLLALAMIGGSVVSTTGGLKVTRVVLLIRRAANELGRLAYPSSAARSHFAGQRASDEMLTTAWLYAMAYPVGIGVTAIALGMTGLDLDPAWRGAAALLTNAGPLAGIDYSVFSDGGYLVSCLAMVFGRMEILITFAAFFVIISRD